MKEVITMRSVQLTDEDIAFCISAVCAKLLGRPVTCRTYCDVNEYWGAISDEQKFTTKELLDLLGDMRLCGGYLNAHITGFKAGHTINTKAAKALRALLK